MATRRDELVYLLGTAGGKTAFDARQIVGRLPVSGLLGMWGHGTDWGNQAARAACPVPS